MSFSRESTSIPPFELFVRENLKKKLIEFLSIVFLFHHEPNIFISIMNGRMNRFDIICFLDNMKQVQSISFMVLLNSCFYCIENKLM